MGGFSRRDVLKIGASALAGVAVGAAIDGGTTAVAGAANGSATGAAGPNLQWSTFEALVGATFTLQAPSGDQSVVLVAVTQHPTARPGSGACFSLLFSVPQPEVPSGTYPMSQPSLGTFSLLISPVGPPGAGRRYEAVVNHL